MLLRVRMSDAGQGSVSLLWGCFLLWHGFNDAPKLRFDPEKFKLFKAYSSMNCLHGMLATMCMALNR
jgi:hypothetical protein